MSSKRLDSINDLARHGYNLKVICAFCGHHAELDSREIGIRCTERGWSRSLDALERRFKCSICGLHDATCSAIERLEPGPI